MKPGAGLSMRVLVIEDEPRMLELLAQGLYAHGFTVMTAADGPSGLAMACAHQLDAVVLDIGLPGIDGFTLVRALRQHGAATPVLILTARDSESDIIHGLDLGADDYLTKPFSFPELVARLLSITRRQRVAGKGLLEAGEVTIDPLGHTARRNGAPVDLTQREFRLLACLAQRAGQCLTRQELLQCVWGCEHNVTPGALDVLVNALRGKLDSGQGRKLLATVRGRGYLLRLAAEEDREVPA